MDRYTCTCDRVYVSRACCAEFIPVIMYEYALFVELHTTACLYVFIKEMQLNVHQKKFIQVAFRIYRPIWSIHLNSLMSDKSYTALCR